MGELGKRADSLGRMSSPDAVLARKMWRTLEPVHGMIYFAPSAATAYAELGVEGQPGYFASRAGLPTLTIQWHFVDAGSADSGAVNGRLIRFLRGLFLPMAQQAAASL